MLMIAPGREKNPLGIFLVTRLTVTPASRPRESDALSLISGVFSAARHRCPIGGRMKREPDEGEPAER
jgi:hypothetical protein